MRPRREIPRKWFKAKEAAQYANERGYPEVTLEMVRANVSLDLLPAYAIGQGFFYRLRREDIEEWLEQHPWDRPSTFFRVDDRWIAELD